MDTIGHENKSYSGEYIEYIMPLTPKWYSVHSLDLKTRTRTFFLKPQYFYQNKNFDIAQMLPTVHT